MTRRKQFAMTKGEAKLAVISRFIDSDYQYDILGHQKEEVNDELV